MLPLRLSDTKAENARYINAAAAVLADLKTRRMSPIPAAPLRWPGQAINQSSRKQSRI
jgi:hypothetical protein